MKMIWLIGFMFTLGFRFHRGDKDIYSISGFLLLLLLWPWSLGIGISSVMRGK